MANGGCCKNGSKKKNSTLPPPCCHCRPVPFVCPKNGCPPLEPCPLVPRCPPSCSPLIWKTPPKKEKEVATQKPTLCIARPCPQRPGPVPYSCRSKAKLEAPPSTVTFAIRYTCEGPTYCPCYSSGILTCPSKKCC